MEIELIPETVYTVRANGREIRGMRVTSTWEGLRKLEDPKGGYLIVADTEGPMSALMREVLSAGFGGEGRRCVVIMGSPDMVMQLTTDNTTNNHRPDGGSANVQKAIAS